MTSKEIEELQEKVYDMSSSRLPLDRFFNDIRDNPNENYDKEYAYKDLALIVNYINEIDCLVEKLGIAVEYINEVFGNDE